MRTAHKNGKFKAALDLLNEAAQEKKERLFEVVEDQYAALKETLAERAVQGKEKVVSAKEKIVKSLHQEEEALWKKAKEIDKQIRHNPWPFVGAAAFGAFVMGLRMGRKGKKKAEAQPEIAEAETETEAIK